MLETEVFQKGIVGRDGFIWWIGQVASDSWRLNNPGSSAPGVELNHSKGFDYRYQVRIMGYHTADIKELPNDQLPWATVMYPVTTGGGFFNSGSPGLEAGNFVYGFFLDGEDAQQPVILGILGYNKYNLVSDKIPQVGFQAFGGYSNPMMNGIPTYLLSKYPQTKALPNAATKDDFAESNEELDKQIEEARENVKKENTSKTRRMVGNDAQSTLKSLEDKKEKEAAFQKKVLASGCTKDASGVQVEIRLMIQKVQKAQKSLTEFSEDVLEFQEKVQKTQVYINQQIRAAGELITGWLKDKIDAIMQWLVKKLGDAMKPILANLQPDQSQDVKSIYEKALELLVCFFKKILANLLTMVLNALVSIVNRWINVPLCAAENFVAAIVGALTGLINGIMGAITGVINGVLSGLGTAIGIMDDIIGFLDAILSIFEICDEEKPECPRVTDWSIWDGSDSMDNPFDVGSLVDKIKGFASNVSSAVDPDNFDFDGIDFDNLFSDALEGCDTGPQFCGPPEVHIWGGSGNGAAGNAIIGAIGDVIGVDIINAGHGYDDRTPFIRFKDNCGRGNGATGIAITGPVSPTDLKPYQALRKNINKQPDISPNDWKLVTIPTEGLPLWDPTVVYYGERRETVPTIEYLPADENANLKKLYEDSEQAEKDGYQLGASVGVVSMSESIIPADIVAFSPKYIPDGDGTDVGVVDVYIPSTGYGYLPVSDGSQGGDGRTWAESDETTVRHPDGTYDLPYAPGVIVPVQPGDIIRTPLGSRGQIYCTGGDIIEVYGGENEVTCPGVITAPAGTLSAPVVENTYPIVLYICGADILNPGFGYEADDKVIIQPDNGAVIEPLFGPYGNLISLKIINGGEGFQEMPRVYIDSDSGANAEIGVTLCVERIGEEIVDPGIQDKVVSVVDCVGKV